ncbi:MAG: S41 family peptidase [Firmicutes bacterium]|nr:S41 family peptidase [Bacillota bacterium]
MKKSFIIVLCIFLLTLAACAQEFAPTEQVIDASAWANHLRVAALNVNDELKDYYAAYFTPDEFRLLLDNYNGSFAGIGIYMNQDEQGRVLVVSVIPNRPAQAAGLEGGDIILAVDGIDISGMELEVVMMRLRGEEGVDVTVDLLRERKEGDLYYSVTITRAIIESDSISGELLDEWPGIAYIDIYDFTERTPQEFFEMLVNLNNEHEILGLILDLRNNGGGSFNAALSLADFFVPKAEPIVWEKTYGGERCHRSYDGSLNDLPVVCLQNEFTASASEVLIGALKDYGVATVIGTVSFGKGITQALDTLEDGAGVKYTRSRYYTPLKYDLHGKGIEPDIEVEVAEDTTYEEYFDPHNKNNIHIKKAVEQLNKRIYTQVFK